MPSTDGLLDWKGRVVVDLLGYRIGRLVDLPLTSETDVPEWGCIMFDRLGFRRRLVPLGDAELLAGQVRVPYTKAMVQGAPAWPPQASCRLPRDHALREYYGLGQEPSP